jgi:hypothetical protein
VLVRHSRWLGAVGCSSGSEDDGRNPIDQDDWEDARQVADARSADACGRAGLLGVPVNCPGSFISQMFCYS